MIVIKFISFKLFDINIFIVCSTFLMVVHPSNAQEPNPDFRHISIEQGLQIRSVQDFLFDSAHNSWIAAANKLIKYDGHSFEKFEDDLLLNQTILRVIPGAENVFWLLLQNTNLENSLLQFKLEDNAFIPYEYLVSTQNYPVIHAPTEFYQSPDGLRFLTTQSGEIYKLENESVRKVFQLDTEMEVHDFVALENRYWLITDEGIIKLDLEFNIESRIRTEKQSSLVPIDKNVWVYDAEKGFYPINDSIDEDSDLKMLPLPKEIQALAKKPLHSKDFYWHQSSQSLWITFNGILFNWDWDTGEVKDFSSSLTNFPLINTISSISEDHNRQIWFGTSDGILIYNPVKFDFESFFTLEQTKKQLSLRGIALRENSMYVNSYLGLLHYDFEREKYFLKDSVITVHLLGLKFGRNGKLLQGISKTLKKIDLRLGIEETYLFDSYNNSQNQSNWDIWEIHQDNSGKIWLGTEEGLAYLDEKTKKIKLTPSFNGHKDNLPKRVYDIYESENQFWLATLTGLFLYDPIDGWLDLEKEHNYLDQLRNIPIVHLHKDKEGIFWLATDGNGLIKWDKENSKIQFFNTQSGLTNNHIHAIYEDSANGLWLASNGGIMRFDKETFSLQHFTLENGLPHIEFNRASHTQDSLGNLYFGGVAGLVKFNPENFLKLYKSYSGELLVKNIKFLSKTTGRLESSSLYNAAASIEIPPDYSGFELDMHLHDYMDGHIYAYTVDDYEDDWIYQTNPKILIAGLASGDHKIVIKAQNKFGQWLDQRTLYFTVIPPFYQTLWFWLMVALSCSGIGFLFYKEKTRRIKKLNLKLEEEVKERTLKIESGKILLEKQAKKLEEQERQKAAFYANISHDLRTPMTLIKGPFEHILKRSEDHEISNLAQMGIQHTEITLKLIDQLIELSRKEQLEEQVAFKTLDLAAYVKGLTLSFESLAETQHINLSFRSDPEKILIESDPDLLEKIVYNLLSNAFKYTSVGGNIEVRIKLEGDTCGIQVKDSGIGISQRDLPFIFDRYFQSRASKSKPQGVGLGLSIVRELVKRLDGEITVESQLNQGTVFHINLPVRDNQSEYDAQADTLQIEDDLTLGSEDFPTDTFEEEPVGNTGKIILIVDDIFAIRQYISYNLGQDFRILEADNGHEGLEMARTHIPDLIICDVKMPLMDGFSFCKLIKDDVAFSHIPVILLTAMADMENKIKGLDAGAEDYLYKPFNSKELILKVQNLLQHQEKLAAFYSKSLVSPGASTSTFQLKPKEQHFLDEVTAKIHLHLEDENFSVVELSELLCMSRKNLHRKIKALTDQSPSLLIRSIRLGEAMKKLKEGRYNISEVAFMVGFSSPAYFTKCFQELYGMAPKEVGLDGG